MTDRPQWSRNSAALLAPALLALPLLSLGSVPLEQIPGVHLQDEPAVVGVEPEVVQIGLFFNGTTVRVEGDIPVGSQAAIVLTGEQADQEAKIRGKVWGVLWVSTGRITFVEVPTVYLAAGSDSLNHLASPAVRERIGLGYEALTSVAVSEAGDAGSARELFSELVQFKEKQGYFSVTEKSVQLVNAGGGRLHAETELLLPANIPAGDYEIRLYAFHEDEASLLGSCDMRVEQVGLPAMMTRLAVNQGLLYGVGAVIIAVIAGLMTGLVFGRGKGEGH